jgi:predicted TPR repeat methyltransferase
MTPLSNDTQYVAKLQLVERQIAGNELQLAAQGLNALVKAQPQDPRVFLLGACMARANNNRQGEFDLAVKAHNLAPQWAPATIHMAGVLAGTGQTEQALAMAEQAVQQTTDPSHKGEVLLKAAAVARQSGNHEKTLGWLRQADELQPGVVAIRYKLAMTLIAIGDYAGAIDILSTEITSHPTLAPLLSARFTACLGAGRSELALADALAMVALEPDNETYAFYLAFARGDNPSKLPPSLMGQHFDEFSSTFDQHMVIGLKYTLPRDVAQMIQAWHPDKKVDVLDLGCGTGLLGACLGPMEGVLVGVELSTEMIRQAHQHGVYHRFHQVNLLDALQATPPDLYHVIAALDVLIYVGGLDGVVNDAFRVLLPGGRFVFSCESDPKDNNPFTLQSTLRFRHSQSYVARLLEQAGFVDVTIEQRAIRLEAGEPVQGVLVTACKPLNPVQKKAVRKAPMTSKSAK